MRSSRLKAYPQLIVSALLLASAAAAEAQSVLRDRITGSLHAQASVVLRGSLPPLAQARDETGRIDGAVVVHGVSLHLGLSSAQQADLDELLRQQQDPLSPNYHAWLTPQQYASRFGLSTADQERIKSWLRSQGLHIDSVSASGKRISFSGSAASIETAFRTELHRFSVGGAGHFANTTELSVPAALSDMLLSVRGLDDFHPRPRLRGASPRFTSSISGDHFLAPDDFATIYDLKPLYAAGISGSGGKIAVVGQALINLSDIRDFRTAAGLPANDPQLVPGPDAGSLALQNGSEDMSESDIDIEWSGGVAPDATIEFVYDKDVFDALNDAIEQNLAPVVSISYGICETGNGAQIDTVQGWLQQANAQGQTVIASSGDAGAADCDSSGSATASHGLAVDFPASSPNVTGVGGTEFNDASGTYWSSSNDSGNGSALSYIPEIVWNDTGKQSGTSPALGIYASGGGVSAQFSTKPSWQTGTGVPEDGARDVPDIALAASNFHDMYLYCTTNSSGQATCDNGGFRFSSSDASTNNTLTVAGGTSFGAPAFAAILTLVAERAAASGGLGNVNPRLYQLAAATTDVFHDIVSGNNELPTASGSSIGYSAGTGYDLTTGLGSMDVNNLAAAWAPASGSGSSSSSSGSSSSSSSGGAASGGTSSGGGAFAPALLVLLGSLRLLRHRRRQRA
jgi:subtilase family serine protease